MIFAQRLNGVITGAFRNPQPGYAEEELADDNAEVLAFLNPPAGTPDLAPYQFRSMLQLSGKAGDLTDFIAALPDPQRTIAQAKLEYSLVFKRDNDLVEAARQALGLTDGQLDALWLQAASIL